jgi:hypothetical protein
VAAQFAGPWIDFEAGGMAKLKAEPGREIYTVSAEQADEWKRSADPIYKQWSDDVRKVGAGPDTVMKELKDALAEFKAGL